MGIMNQYPQWYRLLLTLRENYGSYIVTHDLCRHKLLECSSSSLHRALNDLCTNHGYRIGEHISKSWHKYTNRHGKKIRERMYCLVSEPEGGPINTHIKDTFHRSAAA